MVTLVLRCLAFLYLVLTYRKQKNHSIQNGKFLECLHPASTLLSVDRCMSRSPYLYVWYILLKLIWLGFFERVSHISSPPQTYYRAQSNLELLGLLRLHIPPECECYRHIAPQRLCSAKDWAQHFAHTQVCDQLSYFPSPNKFLFKKWEEPGNGGECL